MQSQRSSAFTPPGSVSPIEMDEPQISRRHNTKTHTSGRSPSAANAILDNPEPNNSQSEANAFHVVGRDLQIPRPSRSGSLISLLTTFSDDEDDDAGLFRMTLLTGSGLNGRDSELSQLESAYRRVCDPHKGASEVVFVHGCTGTGKSALVQSLGNPILQVGDEEAYFVYGKFDVHNKNDPFSALTSAFSDICDLIMQSNHVTDMKKNIKDALGNDTQVMISLISTLSMLIGESDQHSNAVISDEELPRSPQDFTRLKLKFRAFLRAVATAEHPVILVLDDVHLASTAGVDIVNALLTDTRSTHALIVVTYSDEFNEKKTLQPLLCLQTDCMLMGERHLTTTDIELGNLDLDAVNMIISDLTESNPEASLSLSEVVASKTHGNAFFVLQFLEMLVSRRLLSFSTQKGLWEWDVSKIQLETMVSDNVGELVASKIERLNQNVKEALQVASCFGSSFDVSLLRTVLASEIAFRDGVEVPQGQLVKNGEGVLFKEGLDRILAIAVKERVIERGSGAHRYKFTHDKIQACLYSMIPEGKERCLLHLRIGKLVMYQCESHGMDPSLLLAANQMNHGVEFVVEDGQKVDLAALNLKAARLARARSAYVPASQYLSVARGVLGEDRWFTQYELALELANFGAEMEYCSANFVKCQELIDEVLAFSVSPQDRFRAYYVEIDSLRAQDRLLDALDLGFKVLAQFKISFPKKPSMIDVAVSLTVTSSKVPKFVDDILRLPLLTDKDKLACMKIMGISALCAFFLEKGREFTLLSLRMMHFTLRYGLSDMSALSLGTFGLIKIFTGKYQDGLAFGKLSLRLFKHMNRTECDAPSLFMVYCYTNHWHMPLETMLAPLQQACAHGIATSEIGFGLLAGYNRVVALASLGTPLDIVDNEIRAIQEQCHEFKQDNVTRLLAPTHQAGLNLQGRSSFPLILTGTSMDQQSLTEEARMAKNTVLQYVIAFNQLKLGLHFQEWQLAADLLPCIEKYRKLSKGLTKHFTVYDFTLVAGISYAVLWRRSGERMHLKLFQRYLTQSKGWLSSGLLQCEANYAFLLAEKAVFSNAGPIAIKRAYDEAIVKLEQAQLLHFRAFANERAGTVLQELKVFGDVVEYYTEAQALYYEYGAYAKVDQLERKIDDASAPSLRPA